MKKKMICALSSFVKITNLNATRFFTHKYLLEASNKQSQNENLA